MKLKKKILISIIFVLLASVLLMINNSYASTGPLYLNIKFVRNSGYVYKALEKEIFKIVPYTTADGGAEDLSKFSTFYCIKAGPGFGSDSMSSVGTQKTYEYTRSFDMNYPDLIKDEKYKNALPTGEKYNALVWILKHCYVPAPQNASDDKKEIAESYRKELLTNAYNYYMETTDPDLSANLISLEKMLTLSDDEIDIAQQLAIWVYTNDDNVWNAVNKNNGYTFALEKKLGQNGTYESIGNIDIVRVHALFKYLVVNAEKNASTALNTTEVKNPVSLVSENSTISKDSSNYILGPYKINEEVNNLDYGLEGTVVAPDGTTKIPYTLLDSNKQETTKTLKELIGTEFYISVPNQYNASLATFKVTTNIYITNVTYWSTEAAYANDQPVAEVERTKEEFNLYASNVQFDLALRKFITNINGQELVNTDGTYVREPSIDLSPLTNKTATTANYNHRKDPIGVAVGDIVIYTLRVYNEGKIDGYASKVTDYLPPQLEFVDDDELNIDYRWRIDDLSLRKVSTDYLAKETDEDNLLKAFDGTTLDYKELKIKCKVVSTENLDEVITNIAEITAFTDAQGNTITDIDSQAKNVSLPSDQNLPDYKGNESNKSTLTDSSYFYKGQQDDDDFEKLILEEFDLALRKFITGVNDEKVTNRVPVFTNVKDENGNYIYEHTKVPVEVETADIVEYTIRIYNEGQISGYAKEIKDNIPEGIEFLPENDTNKEYRWIMLDEEGNETTDANKAKYITTDYLSKEQEKTSGGNLIKAFSQSEMESPDYKEVKAAFKVVAPSTHPGIITNTAEISDDSNEEGNPVIDIDSTPNNNNEKEDDIDVEHIKLSYFDLALRKFITGVNDKEVTNRYPVFKIDENGKYVYEHTKEPVDVLNGDIVIYTLRVYNEGLKAGYAEEVKDDIPEGIEFLPDNDINKEYRFVMLDEEGNETDDVEKAVSVKTDALSKAQSEDNLIKAFNKDTMTEPDYKEVKIAFRVTEPNTSDRIIINHAQISEDADEEGKPVIDIDSTPDKWIEDEDDQDIEKIKVKYFDLALRKWVTQAIVIENGKETITETGHKAEDDPEEIVKVELVESKLNKVVVKFRYKIRITNEGEIAGYATEISDYIPQGLKFVAADNPSWKEVDGKIVTDQLKDTLLQPGESAEVEVLLTWINSKDNFDLKVNIAEISKDKNDSNTPDIDSTPNNQKDGEDDIDDAPVILSIKTGEMIPMEYIITISGATMILAAGAILIKKFVL